MKITNIIEAQRYLYKFTPAGVQQIYSGGLALERPRAFYKLLGNPQNAYKVLHIAGTSGKGSTCYYLSHLLQGLGFDVGLSISPHLYDIRERLQVNNLLISEADFCEYLTDIIPSIEKMKETTYGYPTYFEIMQGMAFYTFRNKKVEYAVIETGLGGRYDPANTVTREDKVAVITKIGFDHQKILGSTLSKIALEKAKIIQKNNLALSIQQKPVVEKVLDKVATEENTRVEYIQPGKHFKNMHVDKVLRFDFLYDTFKFNNLQLASAGLFQAENVSLSLATIIKLAKRDGFIVDEVVIRKTLQEVTIAGRMEMITHQQKTFILDGAHNPQKMVSFTESLKQLYPGRKLTFILAFKQGKNVKHMLKYIIPLAKKIIITQFTTDKEKQLDKNMQISRADAVKIQGYHTVAVDPKMLAKTLTSLKFSKFILTHSIDQAISTAIKSGDEPIIITGSLYLIGNTNHIFTA